MKKTLLLLVFCVIGYVSFANLSQGAWRWRADDGSETTATYLEEENTAPIISTTNTLRLRVEIDNDTDDSYEYNNNIYLEDSVAGSGVWTPITTDGTSNAFVLAGSSPNVTDLQATTNQLTGVSSQPFQPGLVIVSSPTFSFLQEVDMKTEMEWVIKPTANIQTNTVYYFRVTGVDYGFAPIISLITDATLPIVLQSFTVQAVDKKVKLDWVTASEVNNDRFEILRSPNGKTDWKVVATVKGHGTSTQSHAYSSFDNAPISGKNFYKLKQIDFDGKSKESEIKLISMQILKSLASVFPNPSKGDINIKMSDFQGNVSVVLSDLKGNKIHQEIINVNGNNTNYKLNLRKTLASGMYVMQLQGDNLEQSIKVVVQ